MEDLSKADFRTIKTFITNNISAERLLKDVLQQSVANIPLQDGKRAKPPAPSLSHTNRNQDMKAEGLRANE